MVAADMVVMAVRIQHHHRQFGERFRRGADVADTEPGIEQQGALGAENQIGDDFFELARLINCEHPFLDPVNLEPARSVIEPVESTPLLSRQYLPPVRFVGPTTLHPGLRVFGSNLNRLLFDRIVFPPAPTQD
jgi:hypothetical protein